VIITTWMPSLCRASTAWRIPTHLVGQRQRARDGGTGPVLFQEDVQDDRALVAPGPGLGQRGKAGLLEQAGPAHPHGRRRPAPWLNNSLGIVHGGVSAMALKLVGSAAVNDGCEDQPLHTASLRVNFLRKFCTFPDGPESRYEGTALRVGRSRSRRRGRSALTARRRSSPVSPATSDNIRFMPEARHRNRRDAAR
jgi:acyl-coenzyme A thioesterase PaaI-like protein